MGDHGLQHLLILRRSSRGNFLEAGQEIIDKWLQPCQEFMPGVFLIGRNKVLQQSGIRLLDAEAFGILESNGK